MQRTIIYSFMKQYRSSNRGKKHAIFDAFDAKMKLQYLDCMVGHRSAKKSRDSTRVKFHVGYNL